ncbi:uncharacterized protein LOC132745235, partial [Ruditapes philippinarum]|uniref:uncharacterized protein LOC132745235 n=1 Tax=Ruditapes philippinarum TaxID=129788 RepID=UPI00295B5671
SGMQAVVNQTEDQLRRKVKYYLFKMKSQSHLNDINTISDDKGQSQGHLRSLLHHEEVKANHSCTEQQYRTCDFNPEASSRVCVTRQHQMCGKMSSELKRKIEIDKENICYWKRQKTTGRQKFKRDRAAMKEMTRNNLTDMYTSNVSQELFSLQEDIVEKLHIQERPSQARAREVLTDLESRRILHALNRDHKPLFAIIPDLQFGPKAPKLKYFVPPLSHMKNKEAASDDTRTESADVLPSTSLDDTSQFKPVLPCQSMQSSTDMSTETGNKNSAPIEILFPAQSSLPLSTAAQNVRSGNSRNSTQPSISLTATESDTSLASAELHCLANSSEQFSTFKPELGIGTNLTEQSKPESLFHPDQLTSRLTGDKLTAEKFLPMETVKQESDISCSGIQQIQPMATDKSESGTSSSGFQFSATLSKSLSMLKQDPGTSSSGFQCPAQPSKQVSAFKPDLGTSRWTGIQSPAQQSQPRPIVKPEPGTSPSGFQLPAQQYQSLSTGKAKPDTNSSGFQSTTKQSQSLPIFKQKPSTSPSGFQFPDQPLISMTLTQENTGTSRSNCDITSFKCMSSILSVGQNETSFSVNSESKESNGLTRHDSGFITTASSASSTNSAIDSSLTLSTDKTPTTVLNLKEEPNQSVTQSSNSMPNFQFDHKSTPVSVSEQNSGYGFDNRNDISKQSIPTGQNYGVGVSVFNSQDKTRSLDRSFNHPADNFMAQERLVSSIAIESSDKPKDGSLNSKPSNKDTVSSVDSKSASTNSVT